MGHNNFQPTHENIHSGFSGLNNDDKWVDVLNFRFAEGRTTVVPNRAQMVLPGLGLHTLIAGNRGHNYAIGECGSIGFVGSDVFRCYCLWRLTQQFLGENGTRGAQSQQLVVRGSYTGSKARKLKVVYVEGKLTPFWAVPEPEVPAEAAADVDYGCGVSDSVVEVQGVITDNLENPIAGALIRFVRYGVVQHVMESGPLGEFFFPEFYADYYEMSISYDGYFPLVEAINIQDDTVILRSLYDASELVEDYEFRAATLCGFSFPTDHPAFTANSKKRFFGKVNEIKLDFNDRLDTTTVAGNPGSIQKNNITLTEQIKFRDTSGGSCATATFSQSIDASVYEYTTSDTDPAYWALATYVGTYYLEEGVLITQTGQNETSNNTVPTPVVTPNLAIWSSYNFQAVDISTWAFEPADVQFLSVQSSSTGDLSGTAYVHWILKYEEELTESDIAIATALLSWAPETLPTPKSIRYANSSALANASRQVRVRFKIPFGFPGVRVRVDFEILQTTGLGVTEIIDTENLTWFGPGDALDADDDSWYTDWHEIPYPTDVAGTYEVANITLTPL